ncbi:group 1 glycosyl transferase [Cupriavidus basilensis OR16]|uniref:Group 1 glycosyl transferase n=1 Tax=Cupriavidus basilensis OR16 TaxID=1127483 RepID=H1SBH0_9BURK|nr:glycosyltransferase [Cupriavidus basilensis]EHP40138.1 group 1 glycosyl transferase [Cupriavidus basilensis OR16]
MRILLLTTGLKLGGAEQQVAALARQFIALGHSVAVVSLTRGCEVMLPDAATILELGMHKTPTSMARALWRLRAFVRDWRPDIIHAHMVHANLFARAISAITTAPPVICTAHSVREGGRLLMLAYRLTDRWGSLITHVSPQGRQAMIEAGAAPGEHFAVMPNGIDTTQFSPDPTARQTGRTALGLSSDTRLILNVGRLVPQKSQLLLIEAFALLDPSFDTRLMIVGDGPERYALGQAIQKHNLESRVILAGTRRDITTLLNAADLFALSSSIEGMPLAVGEALACGCPVVATDAAGVVELLGDCGDIVPRGNASALAEAMRKALAAGIGSAADQEVRRQRITSRFGLEAVARQWLTCYAKLRLASPAAYAGSA